MTVAVPVMSSRRTSLTLAGCSARITNSVASSENGTMSTFSPRSSLVTMRTRAPRAPTQAPTGSTLASFDQTAILVRWPGSRAHALISTTPVVAVVVQLLAVDADVARLGVDGDDRLLGGVGHALVGGDERVGERVEQGVDRDSLLPRDQLERLEELEVAFHVTALFFVGGGSVPLPHSNTVLARSIAAYGIRRPASSMLSSSAPSSRPVSRRSPSTPGIRLRETW